MLTHDFARFSQELKAKFLLSCFSFVLCFILCLIYSDALYFVLIKPLLSIDPNRSLLFTDVREGFQTTVFIGCLVSFLFVIPYIAYIAWIFTKPALYDYETNLPYGYFLWGIMWVFIIQSFVLPGLWGFFIGFEAQDGCVNILFEARVLSFLQHNLQVWVLCMIFLGLPIFVRKKPIWRLKIWVGSLCMIALVSPPDFLIQIASWLIFALFLEILFIYDAIDRNYVRCRTH